MNQPLTLLRRACRISCALSLLLAANAFGAAGSRLDPSDITKPDFFPILPWSPYHGWKKPFVEQRQNGLESIAECQFNLAGFVWPKDLRRCEKLGLGAIVVPAEGDELSPAYRREWKKLPDAEIERRVQQLIRSAGR